MENLTLLQFRKGDLNLDASITTYSEAIAQQGFPDTHEQLLGELFQWIEPDSTSHVRLQERQEQVLNAIESRL